MLVKPKDTKKVLVVKKTEQHALSAGDQFSLIPEVPELTFMIDMDRPTRRIEQPSKGLSTPTEKKKDKNSKSEESEEKEKKAPLSSGKRPREDEPKSKEAKVQQVGTFKQNRTFIYLFCSRPPRSRR